MESSKSEETGINGFDFLVGSWRVSHRRLKERLANSDGWIEFAGTCVMRKILGGAGNMDENFLSFPGNPYRAVAFRTYDPAKKHWSIWWIDGRSPGDLDPPLIGGFDNGVGTFYADHTFEKKPIRLRFLWTNLATRPHWEQAFSADNGRTWETNWTMDFDRALTSEGGCCPVVELRQYTLHPGARETLIELFEREFIESQEALGMCVLGTFRDLEKPDRFVWLRGFQDMESRAAQLQQFYGGPVWKKHRDAANATMIDSDNVLLLRPVPGTSGFVLENAIRSPQGAKETLGGVLVAVIHHLEQGKEVDFAQHFRESIVPSLKERGINISAQFMTAHYPNTFPALPVREDANVFAWFTTVASAEAARALPIKEIASKVRDFVIGEPEVLLLAPTARSLLRA